MLCNICPRKCNIDRENSLGFCGVPNSIYLARAALHFWEEPIICDHNGSGAIFFSGCNLKCLYCQNYDISRGKGKQITIQRLADIFKQLEDSGACNINLVTPTHYAVQIVNALQLYRPKLPIIFNCGGYESLNTLKMLDGLIDIYLPDFKYADNSLAFSLSNVDDYFQVTTTALLEMKRQVGHNVIDNGLLKKGMIIRHLVLPNHLKNTYTILDWLGQNFDSSTIISLMGQFLPCGSAKYIPTLDRKLKPLEYKLATNYLLKLGFDNAYIQDLSSSDSDYIPDFNFDGV